MCRPVATIIVGVVMMVVPLASGGVVPIGRNGEFDDNTRIICYKNLKVRSLLYQVF